MANKRSEDSVMDSSPSATGPAGALFEGQVGAHYLLTMIAEANPRGMPEVLISRIALQGAGDGYPLDDVIIHGITNNGNPTVLEIQVKRTITFAPSDAVFKKVVNQLGRAFAKIDLSNERHQFAIATERTSSKITGPYQDVLRWAREVSLASTFIDRINRKNVGNADMRTFVDTLRSHLEAEKFPNDDETIWQMLRRIQILTFDYDSPGSQSHELALDRARNTLNQEDANRASSLWKVLTETAIRVAASGGGLDRTRLLSELNNDSFRMRGSWRNQASRKALTEASTLAVVDLQRRIAGVTLARTKLLDAVRKAQCLGRYIEIRGGPGVGKSGLLGMLAQQILNESCVIVLSPERTISGGWLALKSVLETNLSPQEFLADLASDGGAVLFVDSLDFFQDAGKRATVVDLVRSATKVPNFQIIVTARTDFDREEVSWLPADVLAALGRVQPIVIKELDNDEIDELKNAAPSLSALLANNHPARDISRNLFRLSRLLEVQGSSEELRTEVDLLDKWWKTADGASSGHRERARLLVDLSDAILAGHDHIKTRAAPEVIDALLSSGTLRELGFDRFAFRHDVLSEWGVAAQLHNDPSKFDLLPLEHPALAALARGVELSARYALERSESGENWITLLNSISYVKAHVSWRRWALLAILRSEIALTLLDRASDSLFAQNGALLKELIRTTIAVDSLPLKELFAETGANLDLIPSNLYGPSNNSWVRLVSWLLNRRVDLPIKTIPDVVDLFQGLSTAFMLLAHPLTSEMVVAVGDWLEEIDDACEHKYSDAVQPRFAAAFRYHDLYTLAKDLRQTFSFMAVQNPRKAQTYLQKVLIRQEPDKIIRDIMEFRGTLAQAAPVELAEITIIGLIPKTNKKFKTYYQSANEGIFSDLNNLFLPSSPAQGPFLELLNAAPETGLVLIRRLVSHAVTNKTDDGITLTLSEGTRFFSYIRSYYWSRNADSLYVIESALMALEAWSHKRIEQGDDPSEVIQDILGPEGSSAAFLLIAVDILISHWPHTKEIIIPFLGSPELLSLDRSRQSHDSFPSINLMGWETIGSKEPVGSIQLSDLRTRLSRRVPLERLLGTFALSEDAMHWTLYNLLETASLRLGDPEPEDTCADPRFMARYALNLINSKNWHPRGEGYTYVSPPDEDQHFVRLEVKYAPRHEDVSIDAAISNALENKEKSSPDLASYAVNYAKRLESIVDTPEDALKSRTNLIVSAAMIVARDGSDHFLEANELWVRGVFMKTISETDSNYHHGMNDGIRFNPVAIATLGLIHLWRRGDQEVDRKMLLVLAGRHGADTVNGFGTGLEIIREMDRRLIPAILRCAISAQVRPVRERGKPKGEQAADLKHREKLINAVEAECAWLRGEAEEPTWPSLPFTATSVRPSLQIGWEDYTSSSTKSDSFHEQFNSQIAALWLKQLTRNHGINDLNWQQKFVLAYVDWSAHANGAGLDERVEVQNLPIEWNNIFFHLMVHTFLRINKKDAVDAVVRAITIPDKSFFYITPVIIPSLDELYFGGRFLDLDTILSLRGIVIDRLVQSAGWLSQQDQASLSIEITIAPAISVLFFNHYNIVNKAQCYLREKGIEQVDPFISQLTRLIEVGPVPFITILTMNLLEVSHKPQHLGFFLSSALTWLRRQPKNTQLWIDAGLGMRLTKWLERIIESDASLYSADHSMRTQIDDVLARLVQIGVAEASQIERRLIQASGRVRR